MSYSCMVNDDNCSGISHANLSSARLSRSFTVESAYRYELSKAQLKAASRTSGLLSGFAMVALVELQYEEDTPSYLLVILGLVTTLLVAVNLLALMMSTCIRPYLEAYGCSEDSPIDKLQCYIDLSWLISTCVGLLLFLVEIGIILLVKFDQVKHHTAGVVTTAMLVPVVFLFVYLAYRIHTIKTVHERTRNRVHAIIDRRASTGLLRSIPIYQV